MSDALKLLASIPSPPSVSDVGGVYAYKAGHLAQRVLDLESALRDLLCEIEDHVDVVDGSDGLLPNWAMRLMDGEGAAASAVLARRPT